MDHKKIPAPQGTIILVIIAMTVFSFVWVYEKNQSNLSQLSNNYEITTPPTTQTIKNKGVYLQNYENKTYGYKLRYAPDSIILPESSDENVIIADASAHRKNIITVSPNAEKLSLDQVLAQTIHSKNLNQKNISITDVLIGQRHGKKVSINDGNYEYGTIITFLNNEHVFTILANERSATGENSFEFIFDSFDFGDGFNLAEKNFIDHSSYFSDQSGIYYLEQFGTLTPLEDVDRKTFQIVGNCAGGEMYFLPYSRDKNHIYIKGEIAKDIDTASFKYFGFFENYDGMPWGIAIAKDKNHIYYGCGKPADSIRKESFKVLNYGYAKDSKSIYYLSFLLKTADYKSFEVLGVYKKGVYTGPFSLDKNNVYFEGRIIKGISPKDCRNRGIESCLPENWHNLILESDESLSPLDL